MTHAVQWQAPQPLWSRFGADASAAANAADQLRPAILRFATDDFMEHVLGVLQRDPSQLSELVARPETWRTPMTSAADLVPRTPSPRRVQDALRRTMSRKPKGGIDPTVEEQELQEQAQARRIPLKLYHPAHQRFYLIGASLVCEVPGFPDRAVARGGVEQLNMVIRRLMPLTPNGDSATRSEYAFVKDATGARWQRVPTGGADDSLVAGEDLLPVFPLAYEDDAARPRTLWAGLAPVGRREEYVSAAVDRSVALRFAAGQEAGLSPASPTQAPSRQRRLTQFQMEVAEPWKSLVRQSFATAKVLFEDTDAIPVRRKTAFEFNLQQQRASWLILLDFADFLSAHLPGVWRVITTPGASTAALTPPQLELYNQLASIGMPPSQGMVLTETAVQAPLRPVPSSLRDALARIALPGVRAGLEGAEIALVNKPASLNSTVWPDFYFLLAGVNAFFAASGAYASLALLAPDTSAAGVPDPRVPLSPALLLAQQAAQTIDRLTALVIRAVEAGAELDAPPLPFAQQVQMSLQGNGSDGDWFVARFVHTNRDCGPLHPPTLSAPSQRFQLASFFDPDAPARPIRISLPVDTSPAGLRKFNKNTAFVLSDMLCGQVQRAKGLGFIDLIRAVLPFPLHKDLDVGDGGSCSNGSVNIGMICSLSIPIITICALILLMIIVSLLDLIFGWLPFFIMCFPVPGLKGKKATA